MSTNIANKHILEFFVHLHFSLFYKMTNFSESQTPQNHLQGQIQGQNLLLTARIHLDSCISILHESVDSPSLKICLKIYLELDQFLKLWNLLSSMERELKPLHLSG